MKEKEILRTLSIAHAKLKYRSDFILEIELKKDVYFTIKESKEINQAIISITGSIPCKVLVEAGDLTLSDSESREWASTAEATKPMLALAIVTKSLPQKLLANFIMNMNIRKTIIPTRVFRKKEEAEIWLASL